MENRAAERGSILILILSSVTLLAGAILGLLTVENGRAQRARTEVERTRAFMIAESGIDQVRVLLGANKLPPSGKIDWNDDERDNDGDGLVDEGDESLRAEAELWWSDLIDNDGDGLVDEDDEGVARVTCTVPIGTSSVTVTGWLERLESVIPINVPAVLTLLDPNSDLTISGNSFRINGTDHPLNGQTDPRTPVLGVAINNTPAQVLNQLTFNQLDNVTGTGGWPSVGTWTPPSPTWLEDLMAVMRPLANISFTNYSRQFKGKLGNWKSGNFLITHSQGDLNVGGGSTGAGVLLVDGDLTISGNWEYVGYVFVTGRLKITGGGNGQILRGAMYVGGDISATATNLLTTALNGGVDLLYSSDALMRVRDALARYDVAAVTEP
ncbi:MAG TPA: hypothetical protein VFI25_02365 [Planctomycetota bacterium]|jgi:hypothetical protein|nr:hypothetical protein [Planctomycetota bacterium]